MLDLCRRSLSKTISTSASAQEALMEIFVTALRSSMLTHIDTGTPIWTYTHTASADEGCCDFLYYWASAAFRGKYLFVGIFFLLL